MGPLLLIFTCIGFNVSKPSKEKQKVILQMRNTDRHDITVIKHSCAVDKGIIFAAKYISSKD